ncbi:DUF485 domain-containing protein [Amycolatopsis thermophila]|uniref:Uncharacterized membrane protein (DUF485 family) n=1 Tax=Amycolatopsis thermophila TaxID=206084 RepID=A0ABU0EXS6_9PSEU|nr:DUF485 domain-containing protein [Amycolatopsis thermophila]MDQ0380129.1 uncharacterized membrane protein (DUF485 family) [Amycolatopsis thermophila]
MQNVAPTAATRNPVEDTGQMRPLFGNPAEQPPRPRRPAGPDFVAIQRSEEFTTLRGRFRRFVFPMSLAFVLWYLAYVLLAAYAHGFMSIKLVGEVNVGMVLGILQFVSTAVITALYLRFARRRIDPEVDEVRRQAGVQ